MKGAPFECELSACLKEKATFRSSILLASSSVFTHFKGQRPFVNWLQWPKAAFEAFEPF